MGTRILVGCSTCNITSLNMHSQTLAYVLYYVTAYLSSHEDPSSGAFYCRVSNVQKLFLVGVPTSLKKEIKNEKVEI